MSQQPGLNEKADELEDEVVVGDVVLLLGLEDSDLDGSSGQLLALDETSAEVRLKSGRVIICKPECLFKDMLSGDDEEMPPLSQTSFIGSWNPSTCTLVQQASRDEAHELNEGSDCKNSDDYLQALNPADDTDMPMPKICKSDEKRVSFDDQDGVKNHSKLTSEKKDDTSDDEIPPLAQMRNVEEKSDRVDSDLHSVLQASTDGLQMQNPPVDELADAKLDVSTESQSKRKIADTLEPKNDQEKVSRHGSDGTFSPMVGIDRYEALQCSTIQRPQDQIALSEELVEPTHVAALDAAPLIIADSISTTGGELDKIEMDAGANESFDIRSRLKKPVNPESLPLDEGEDEDEDEDEELPPSASNSSQKLADVMRGWNAERSEEQTKQLKRRHGNSPRELYPPGGFTTTSSSLPSRSGCQAELQDVDDDANPPSFEDGAKGKLDSSNIADTADEQRQALLNAMPGFHVPVPSQEIAADPRNPQDILTCGPRRPSADSLADAAEARSAATLALIELFRTGTVQSAEARRALNTLDPDTVRITLKAAMIFLRERGFTLNFPSRRELQWSCSQDEASVQTDKLKPFS